MRLNWLADFPGVQQLTVEKPWTEPRSSHFQEGTLPFLPHPSPPAPLGDFRTLRLPKSKVKWKSLSRVQLFANRWTWNSLGQNTGVGSLSLLQWIFPTQGLNPGLPHCRQILYQHILYPRILEWVAYPFSSRSSWPRNQTGVFCIAGRFFTNWVNREALQN